MVLRLTCTILVFPWAFPPLGLAFAPEGRRTAEVSALAPDLKRSNDAYRNLLVANTGNSQEDIDLRWNNMANGCLRAFFFEGNCNDEIGIENGTPTDITYRSTVDYWPHDPVQRDRCANFDGMTSEVNIGSAADIDDLTELTIAFRTFCRGPGGNNQGRILYKAWINDVTRFECNQANEGYVGLYSKIGYTTTHASSLKLACLEQNEWHHVAFTYSQSGDRKVHIFIDATEVTGYNQQVASIGTRISDASDSGIIGNSPGGTCGFNGMITEFLIYNRVLSSAELKWLAHDEYQGAGGDLRVSAWERFGIVDPAKVSHGMVVFDFDDQFRSQLTKGKPVFDAEGVVGCLAVMVANIGAGDRLNAQEIQQFVDSGWEIVSHSMTHTPALGLTEAEFRAELADSKAALEATFGVEVRNWCWPGSTIGGIPWAAYRNICLEYYDAAIGVAKLQYWNLMSSLRCFNLYYLELAGTKALIDTAYANNLLLIFRTHEVDDAWVALVTELIQYVKSKGMPILTLSQALANMKEIPPTPLYGGFSVKCQNVHATDAKPLYQVKTLTAEDYIVSFLAYTDGSAVTSADVVPFAHTALTNKISEFQYEDRGGGVYLAWRVFRGTPEDWNLGVELKPGRTVYIALPTCYAVPACPVVSAARTTEPDREAVVLSWYGEPEGEYEVLWRDTMTGGDDGWQDCGERVHGVGDRVLWSDFGSQSRLAPFDPFITQRYYRVRVCPVVLPAE